MNLIEERVEDGAHVYVFRYMPHVMYGALAVGLLFLVQSTEMRYFQIALCVPLIVIGGFYSRREFKLKALGANVSGSRFRLDAPPTYRLPADVRDPNTSPTP